MLPEPSVTVQVTVVVPIGKIAGASFETDATLQLSDVTGVPSSTPIASQPKLGVTVTFNGAVSTGAVLSPMNTFTGSEVAEQPLRPVAVTV